MRSPLFFLVFLIWIVPAFAAITQSEAKQLQAMAKAYGLPAVLTDAASTYIETGDATPLRRLLLREELLIVTGAAGFLLEAGEPFAPGVVARLKRGEGSAQAQIACLAFATDRASVQYLVDRLGAEPDAKLRSTLLLSLRVVTGRDLTTAEEWSAWWRKQPRRYRPKLRSMEEIMGKVATAESALMRDSLRSIAKKGSGDTVDKVLEKVTDIFGTLAEMQEEGRKLRLSRPAREGDDRFRRGDFAGAQAAYARAVAKQRKDHRSAFLQGCALVELGKLSEAQEIFTRLHRDDTRRSGASFMAELCAREIAAPGKLLDHAIDLRKALGEPEDLLTWGDPTLRMIVGQRGAMVPGPEFVDLEILGERMAAEQDPLILLGLALCHPPQLHDQLFNVLRERFPDHPVILAQQLRRRSSWRTAERRQAELPAIRAWMAAEPDNALPRLLEVAVSLESPTLYPDQAPHVPAETLTRMDEALRLPRYETHVTAAARAQLAAYRSAESASVARVNVAGGQPGISHLFQCVSAAANGAAVRRERELLDRISDIHAAFTTREAAAAQSSIDRAVSLAYRRASRGMQLKDLRDHRADDPRLLELETEVEKLRAQMADRSAQMPIIALEILPLPSLQRAITRRTYQITEE